MAPADRPVAARLAIVVVASAVALVGCSSGGSPDVVPTTTVTETVDPSPAQWPSAAGVLAGMAAAEDLPLTVTPLTAETDPDGEVGSLPTLVSKAYANDARLDDEDGDAISLRSGAFVLVFDSETAATAAMHDEAAKASAGDTAAAPLVFTYGPILVAVSGALDAQDRVLYSAALNEYIKSIS